MSAKRLNTRRSRHASFLLDENIQSDTLAIRLREIPGWDIQLHADHLQPSTSDADVVALCSENSWGLITIDEMRYTDDTKRAMVQGNVRLFKVITHERTHYMHIVASLVIAQARMLEIMHKNKFACCAHVYTNGDVSIVSRFADIPPGLTPQQQKTYLKFGKV